MGDSMDYEELRAEIMANPGARRAYERNRAERAVLAAVKEWRRVQIMGSMQSRPGLEMLDIGKARAELEHATDALLALEAKGGAS